MSSVRGFVWDKSKNAEVGSRELSAGSEQHLRMAISHGGAQHVGWCWWSSSVKSSSDRVRLHPEPLTEV